MWSLADIMTEKYYQSSPNFPMMLCSWKSSVAIHFLEWNLATCWKLKKQLLGMLLDLLLLSLNKDWITCFLEGIQCCLTFLVISCILFIWHRLQKALVPSLSNTLMGNINSILYAHLCHLKKQRKHYIHLQCISSGNIKQVKNERHKI